MDDPAGSLAAGLVLVILGVWLFTRTWWGHLPHVVTKAAIG